MGSNLTASEIQKLNTLSDQDLRREAMATAVRTIYSGELTDAVLIERANEILKFLKGESG